ncbi:hypothetical protein BE11_35475 [Sorangium cellulosum]|nr:hypothetical protein BE11_35475 [Sorangium cellulosum]
MACARGLSATTPPPSPRTYPLARASKVKHRPPGDSAPNLDTPIVLSGMRFRFTPPASASVDSPRRRLSHARWTATSEAEHAVSTERLGPSRPSAYETRLATMLWWKPIAECWVRASGPARWTSIP